MLHKKTYQLLSLIAFLTIGLLACQNGDSTTSNTAKNSTKGGFEGKDLYEPPVGLITPMGKNSNPIFNEGMDHYAVKEWDQALEIWKGIKDKSSTNDTLQFYQGATYFAKKDYSKAVVHFLKTRNVKDSKFDDMTYWYLGVCHYKLGAYDLAKGFLEKTDTPLKDRLLHDMQ